MCVFRMCHVVIIILYYIWMPRSWALVVCQMLFVFSQSVLPVAFYSRELKDAVTRYLATELEGLAVYSSIMHFVHYLFGRKFTVYKDHRALTSLMVLNKRLQGWALRLQEFDFDIQYREGKDIMETQMGFPDRPGETHWLQTTLRTTDLSGGRYGDKPHSEKEG